MVTTARQTEGRWEVFMRKSLVRTASVLMTTAILYWLFRSIDLIQLPTKPFPFTELVLAPHAVLTVTTDAGTMQIEAVDILTRRYTWEGASRSVNLWPREERWYGSLGAYFPGDGDHWMNHNGITRGVLEEGQQHFSSLEEARTWLAQGENQQLVYRGDGLAAGWSKTLERRQLNVSVWQILIANKKPLSLRGSHDDKISLAGDEVPMEK